MQHYLCKVLYGEAMKRMTRFQLCDLQDCPLQSQGKQLVSQNHHMSTALKILSESVHTVLLLCYTLLHRNWGEHKWKRQGKKKRSANFKDSGNSHLATIVHSLCQILAQLYSHSQSLCQIMAQLYSHSQSTIVPNHCTALQSQSINHIAKSWHSSTVTVNQPLCQIQAQLYSHSQSTILPNPGTALQSQSINHCAKSRHSSTVTVNTLTGFITISDIYISLQLFLIPARTDCIWYFGPAVTLDRMSGLMGQKASVRPVYVTDPTAIANKRRAGKIQD